jgi:hypothetical protein
MNSVRIAAIGAACVAGLGAVQWLVPASQAAKGRGMSQQRLSGCEARAATLNLVGEAVMTRASITAETIGKHSTPVVIGKGDPRLATLTHILHGLKLEPAALPRFEMRMLVRVECVDGTTITVAGSRTGQDGRLDLSVDGEPASTHAPLRRELEALAAHA